MFENRTDLALEERESFEGNGGEIGGVALREWRCHGSSIRMTEVSILNEKGAESMGKPMGTYLTMEDPGLSETEDAYCEAAAGELGRQLASLIRKNCASTHGRTFDSGSGTGKPAGDAGFAGTARGGWAFDEPPSADGARQKKWHIPLYG